MSTIDSSNSLNTILDKLGIQKPAEDQGASDKLGQADFLKLMTTSNSVLSFGNTEKLKNYTIIKMILMP